MKKGRSLKELKRIVLQKSYDEVCNPSHQGLSYKIERIRWKTINELEKELG